MPASDPQVVSRRLEEFRRNLLDTSLRNRLIDFRARTKAGKPLEKVVEVFGEDPTELLRILVAEGKAMSFVGRPDPRPAKKDEGQMELDDFGDEASLARFREEAEQEIDAFLATGQTIVDATDLKLNTHDTVSALARKLTKIYRDAKVAVEEQGVNVLFLSLGSLQWFEADASEEPRRAPLILLPVTLERTNAGAFRLRWDGTDPGGNLSIAALLKREFGIRLPELPEEIDPGAYFREVERAVESQGRWAVDRTAVALAFFSYAKYLMYRDLDPAGWPVDGQPVDHETLDAMLGDGFADDEPGIPEDAFLDPLRPVAEVCEVYDADASQTLAILEANSGRTMLIEGPPGTGKSQTITNLIAEAVGAGKKVLFVAEKAAALDVVFRRLREANLGDACLELHSKAANKRAFYAELKRTVDLASPRVARAEADLKRLEEDRSLLNGYAEALNAPLEPFGVSPRYALGHLVALGPEPAPEGRHDFAAMADWTETTFRERLAVVRGLQTQVAGMGRPVDHPFYGSTLETLLPQDRDDLARALREAGEAVERFYETANDLAEALRVELPILPADVDRLREWAAFVAHSPEVRGVDVRADWEALEGEARAALNEVRRWRELRATPGLDASAFERDLQPLRDLLGAADLSSAEEAFRLADASASLARRLGLPAPASVAEIEGLADVARRLATAPDLRGMATTAPEWATSREAVDEALAAVTRLQEAHARYDAVLAPGAWSAPVAREAGVLRARGGSLLRFFSGEFRQAMAASEAWFAAPAPPLARAEALEAVVAAQAAEAALARHFGRMATLFGERWRGAESDAAALGRAASWIAENAPRLPASALRVLEREGDPAALRAEAEALRPERATDDGGAYGFLVRSVRPALAEIRVLVPEGPLAEALPLLDRAAAAQEVRRALRAAPIPALGPYWRAETTDPEAASEWIDWVLGLRRGVAEGRLPGGLIEFFAAALPREGLEEAVRLAQETRRLAQEAVRRALGLARLELDPVAFTETPITAQREGIALWIERLPDLPPLIRYNAAAAEARRIGLAETVALADSWPAAGERLAEAFERSWYTGIVRRAGERYPVLNLFDRRRHEETVEEFRRLDDLSLRYNRAKVALAHWRAVPRGSAGGAMGWLGVQFGLSRSHRPIRVAMERAGEAVQAIKPVFLMSPLSVAMLLPADGPRFDLVIFDEASQVKPEDAFGGILRGRQTVVVGDSKQMPPTSFFDRLTREEETDEEDADDGGADIKELESVLAMMSAKLPAKSPRRRDLRWHYRSRHDALIATSNRLFYDDRLVVFPSPERAGANSGLVLRHDPKTVYGRGGSRKNLDEARAVAQAARKHVLEHPKLTLGIAAFSKPQQEAIQDELDLLRRDEPAFAAFDLEHPFEPLFVKNLENVQGDERDVILISVGYGRDENGYIPASFGPLNRDGGERRLNVLITRARVRCEVFTNLRAGDMRLTENPSRGVLALRTFLAFAETGSLDVPSATGMEPQSPFEEAVLERLRHAGYDVEPQVGSCGFFIDLAVRHPERPQRFVLGIECDGAMYHRARSARDRDKLRQQVLESRGWRIHRIWSTDWFHDPEREFERLTQAIAAAVAHEDVAEETARPLEYAELEREEVPVAEEGAMPYVVSGLRIDLRGEPLHAVPTSRIAEWVARVVADESPIHIEEATRRIREAAEVGQAGSRIRAAIETAVDLAERQGRLVRRGEFLYDPLQTTVPIRSRAGLPGKRLEAVAPEEIVEALDHVVRRAFGIEPGEAAVLAARLLGFERTTAGMAERLRAILDTAVEQERFVRDGDQLKSA